MESKPLKIKSSIRSFTLILFTTLFVAIGQIFFKISSEEFILSIESILLNYNLWIGFVFYGLGLIILILGIKEGELTKLYPVLSLSYVWVLLASMIIFLEPLTATKIIGTICIIGGVSFLNTQTKGEKNGFSI